jgi:hypothetical protein
MIFLRPFILIAGLVPLVTSCMPPAFDAIQWANQTDITRQLQSTSSEDNIATGWEHLVGS